MNKYVWLLMGYGLLVTLSLEAVLRSILALLFAYEVNATLIASAIIAGLCLCMLIALPVYNAYEERKNRKPESATK